MREASDIRNSECYLGIDAGTSACKTVLVNSSGAVLASTTTSYPTHRSAAGEVTQEPRDWLAAVVATVRECRALSAAPIGGIGITAPAHVGVLVDGAGEALQAALLSFDARPESVAAELRREYGEWFFETTFAELTAGWTFPQLVWLRRQLGARAWGRVRYVLMQKDYVRYCLTGVLATDPSDAVGAALVDQRSLTWSGELCARADLSLEQLPPIRAINTVAGGLTRSWAERLGLAEGTPVAVGGTDTVAELISVGALSPGQSIVKIASTGSVVTVCDAPRPHRQLLTYPLGLPDRWYSAAATNTAATAYNWLRSIIATDPGSGATDYNTLESAVVGLPPGADGVMFLPFLEGERVPYWDRQLRGALFGLSSAHSRAHVVRAVMEGVALSLRDCAELMSSVGLAIAEPSFTGGGVRSRVWRSILAGALGCNAGLPEPQGPAVGAALIAQAAVDGTGLSPLPAVEHVVPPAAWHGAYDELYEIYRAAAAAASDISHRLTAFASASRRSLEPSGR